MAKLKRLNLNSIRKLLSLIQNQIDQPKKDRGISRLPHNPDSLHQNHDEFRDTIYFIQNTLKIDAPSLSDLHYRFSKLDEKILKKLFEKLPDELNIDEKIDLIAVNGTGFGYGEKRELKWMRKAQIRKVSSYVKKKLLMEILGKVNIKTKRVLTNALL